MKKTVGMILLENISLEEIFAVPFLLGNIVWSSVNYTYDNDVDYACWPFVELIVNY